MKSVCKILAISVIMLIVASATSAVHMVNNSADTSENKALCYEEQSCKDTKLSSDIAVMIPPSGIAPPPKSVIVNIYLDTNRTKDLEELMNHTVEMIYMEEDRIVAEIYTSEILEIADLPFVTYMDIPIQARLLPSLTASAFEPVKNPKMSTGVAENIPPPGIAPPTKPMIVNIYLKENKTEEKEELENYTTEILNIHEDKIVAEIYTREIVDIVDLPFVSYMDIPLKTQLFPIVSEGIECVNANKQHDLSIRGKGVKVAIIDHGFEGYEDLLGTELPANVTVKSFRIDKDITGGGVIHGTACAEIVHDVAPDAELYLINSDGYVYQLKEIINYLISEKIDVVSHSAGRSAGLFDGTDECCKIIDQMVFNHNISWVNAAGNEAQKHWDGKFKDSDSDGWHEFSCPGGENGQTINATVGDEVVLLLSWNDTWGKATEDYDLYVLNLDNSWRVSSKNPQLGARGHIPFEIVEFVAPYAGTYYILLYNDRATKPVHFELYSYTHELGCKVENSSLCADATAFGVKTVGAVACEDCLTLEDYSSRGPTNDGRKKPDYVGPDCVSTSAFSPDPFCGTSAATPHIAGAIALELSSDEA